GFRPWFFLRRRRNPIREDRNRSPPFLRNRRAHTSWKLAGVGWKKHGQKHSAANARQVGARSARRARSAPDRFFPCADGNPSKACLHVGQEIVLAGQLASEPRCDCSAGRDFALHMSAAKATVSLRDRFEHVEISYGPSRRGVCTLRLLQ